MARSDNANNKPFTTVKAVSDFIYVGPADRVYVDLSDSSGRNVGLVRVGDVKSLSADPGDGRWQVSPSLPGATSSESASVAGPVEETEPPTETDK